MNDSINVESFWKAEPQVYTFDVSDCGSDCIGPYDCSHDCDCPGDCDCSSDCSD